MDWQDDRSSAAQLVAHALRLAGISYSPHLAAADHRVSGRQRSDLETWDHRRTPRTAHNRALYSFLGVSLALFLGFRNSASYDRYWEARKIWGTLLNVTPVPSYGKEHH
jgi:hypothetical protein